MEQQKLPNSTLILVLGILGYLCCCISGLGIIPSGIAYFLATKSEKLYATTPENYTNYSQIKTGKTVALIALVLNALLIIWVIYGLVTGSNDEFMEEFMREFNKGLEEGRNR